MNPSADIPAEPIDPEVLREALHAADRPVIIGTAAEAGRALKAWRRAGVLAVDTEFVREKTYRADLGLVQISDGQTVWLLDPLQQGTMGPVRELLEDTSVTKLLHGPSEDLEVFQVSLDALPRPMIDTQVACALLGQPLQVGYHHAMAWLLDIEVDKGATRSNWLKRPLSPDQLHYAALDVCVLPFAWQRLDEALQALGRREWLDEECERQLEIAQQFVQPEDAWERIRGHAKLGPERLAVLAALASWREKEAQRRNRPRGFIVKDPELVQISWALPETVEKLTDAVGLHPMVRKRYADSIVEIVNATLAEGTTLLPADELDRDQQNQLKRWRKVVGDIADETQLDPALLASKKDLEALLRSQLEGSQKPDKFRGWRREVVTQRLMAEG